MDTCWQVVSNAAWPNAGSSTEHGCGAVQESHPQAPRRDQTLVTVHDEVLVVGARLIVPASVDFYLPG